MTHAIPAWERGKKRRGFGAKRASAAAVATAPLAETETRTFDAPMAAAPRPFERAHTFEEPIATYDDAMSLDRPVTATRADEPLATAPIGRTVRVDRKSGMPAAIAAGVVALGALGAVGWYATQDRDSIPTLTPGVETAEVATAPLAPPPAVLAGNSAEATTTYRAEPPRTADRPAAQPTRTAARARPAPAATSATETGIDASGTAALPAGPQPYSSTSATPAPAAPVQEAAPPAEVTPAPAPEASPEPAAPALEAAPETTVNP
jgi:hypothetical protein